MEYQATKTTKPKVGREIEKAEKRKMLLLDTTYSTRPLLLLL